MHEDNDNIKKYVSGPNNLVRMEGKINNINKVFYIFFDYHIGCQDQLECENIYAIPIKQYLVKHFQNINETDRQIDFLLEEFPEYVLEKHQAPRTLMYIQQLRLLFDKLFNYNVEKNQVLKSKQFPNTRFHYLDIRTYLFEQNLRNMIISQVTDRYLMLLGSNLYPSDLYSMIDGLLIGTSQVKTWYDEFYHGNKKIKKTQVIQPINDLLRYVPEQYIETLTYIINKIKNNYKNDIVKKAIHSEINTTLKQHFDDYFETFEKIKKYLEDSAQKLNYNDYSLVGEGYFGSQQRYYTSIDIIYKGINLMRKLENLYFNIHVMIFDLYYLRRTLDKDYMKTIISYTGALHSTYHVYFLMKYFNFELTHASYINKKTNINQFMENTFDDKMVNVFNPPIRSQCIDITDFPDNFE